MDLGSRWLVAFSDPAFSLFFVGDVRQLDADGRHNYSPHWAPLFYYFDAHGNPALFIRRTACDRGTSNIAWNVD
jgi:hypothetical protein